MRLIYVVPTTDLYAAGPASKPNSTRCTARYLDRLNQIIRKYKSTIGALEDLNSQSSVFNLIKYSGYTEHFSDC